MEFLIENLVCDACGCSGIHACLGSVPHKMSEDEIHEQSRRLRAALDYVNELNLRGNELD